MIKTFCVLLCLSLSAYAEINKQELSRLNIGALIVKDVSTNQMLYSKEPFKEVKPASLTKVMTVLLAIENGHLNRAVPITREMTQVEPTIAGYKRGDIIRMEDLVKAAMIKSDNDAAKAIAITLGGNEKRFLEMMNAKAKSIGMTHTQFTNPCGYDTKGHYSTPIDLLKMTEYAIKNPAFNNFSRLNEHTYYTLNTHKKFYAYTHNRLLNRYEHAIGVKTGYTSKAGACLIARAKKDGKDCLIVMMNAKEDRWKTAKEIFEQVFISKT
jgi:D-alanyl-D-alanine carboxypeptidase (penicillin-binding protein 5/6)